MLSSKQSHTMKQNYNRRKFLQQASVLSAASLIATSACKQTNSFKLKKPIVVSTWDFGVQANLAAWQVLSINGAALDAVEQGVKIPEADLNNQTVGIGGLPDRDGIVTLDACIMDHNGNCGAVLALEHIKHPISVARMVMEKTPHVFLAGNGALQFAKEQGFKPENLLTKESKSAWINWLKQKIYRPKINIENELIEKATPQKLPGNQYNHDTIGMLAIDSHGHMAGACTTSGMAYKMHGRVGDSPIIGAGLYVDNEIGAATATGVGEEVIRNVGSFLIVELMRQGYSPQNACEEAILRIVKRKKDGAKNIQIGFLALKNDGEIGAYAIQKGFSYAVCNADNQTEIIHSESYY